MESIAVTSAEGGLMDSKDSEASPQAGVKPLTGDCSDSVQTRLDNVIDVTSACQTSDATVTVKDEGLHNSSSNAHPLTPVRGGAFEIKKTGTSLSDVGNTTSLLGVRPRIVPQGAATQQFIVTSRAVHAPLRVAGASLAVTSPGIVGGQRFMGNTGQQILLVASRMSTTTRAGSPLKVAGMVATKPPRVLMQFGLTQTNVRNVLLNASSVPSSLALVPGLNTSVFQIVSPAGGATTSTGVRIVGNAPIRVLSAPSLTNAVNVKVVQERLGVTPRPFVMSSPALPAQQSAGAIALRSHAASSPGVSAQYSVTAAALQGPLLTSSLPTTVRSLVTVVGGVKGVLPSTLPRFTFVSRVPGTARPVLSAGAAMSGVVPVRSVGLTTQLNGGPLIVPAASTMCLVQRVHSYSLPLSAMTKYPASASLAGGGYWGSGPGVPPPLMIDTAALKLTRSSTQFEGVSQGLSVKGTSTLPGSKVPPAKIHPVSEPRLFVPKLISKIDTAYIGSQTVTSSTKGIPTQTSSRSIGTPSLQRTELLSTFESVRHSAAPVTSIDGLPAAAAHSSKGSFKTHLWPTTNRSTGLSSSSFRTAMRVGSALGKHQRSFGGAPGSRSRSSFSSGALQHPATKLRRACNCTKSGCLKLYCECFAAGQFCDDCHCTNCANNLEHERDRQRAIRLCIERNPAAFQPKIGKSKDAELGRKHSKGCNCKRSNCLKNYCECYEAKIHCTDQCRCEGCKNCESSKAHRSLMRFAEAAGVRGQQGAGSRLDIAFDGRPIKSLLDTADGKRLPFSFVTVEVIEATSACLLAAAEESLALHQSGVVAEKLVLEEFGRCLGQVIEASGRTTAANDAMDTSECV